MGKVTLTPLQEEIITAVASDQWFFSRYYFTGGTALSAFYYQHRYSEDIDFFSEQPFNEEKIVGFMNKLAETLGMTAQYTKREVVLVFNLVDQGKPVIKVDFGFYPYKRLEEGRQYKGLVIDSLRDIGTNKLLTIIQRGDVKDFVDLFFLLKKSFTLWDLIYGVEAKFRMEIDLLLLGEDFLKVEDFTFLPKMIKPLSLETLKRFFRARAKEVGKRAVA